MLAGPHHTQREGCVWEKAPCKHTSAGAHPYPRAPRDMILANLFLNFNFFPLVQLYQSFRRFSLGPHYVLLLKGFSSVSLGKAVLLAMLITITQY